MRLVRATLLFLLMLVPWVTLVHRDDRGRWDTQRSAMAAPDELSYLLMAQHFLDGGGLSLKGALGRDTFYPPGFPLLLAGWASLFWHGHISPVSPHVLNALLLSCDVLLVFLLTRTFLSTLALARGERLSGLIVEVFTLLITALFATNWHVLETSLLVMSEPAFMLALFGWLLLALHHPNWYTSARWSALLALLATACWSIRGAGIVCVAATAMYAAFRLGSDYFRAAGGRPAFARRLAAILVTLAIPLAYQAALIHYSPEKSLAGGNRGENSYIQQLLSGVDANFVSLLRDHLLDYAKSFLPWMREPPGDRVRYAGAIAVASLAMIGMAIHFWRPRVLFGRPASVSAPAAPRGVHELFLSLYIGLYLVWPFRFERFWSPLLPLSLAYAADGWLIARVRVQGRARWAGVAVCFLLLLTLSAQELVFYLGTYARRLNEVSDALAASARSIIQAQPDRGQAIIVVMGADEYFTLAWYLTQSSGGRRQRLLPLAGGYDIRTPRAQDAARAGKPEHVDDLILRSLREGDDWQEKKKIFYFSYFPDTNLDTRDTILSLQKKLRGNEALRKLNGRASITQVWEVENTENTLEK